MPKSILLFFSSLLIAALLSFSSCKQCSTCFYINDDSTTVQIDSVVYQQACGKKKEIEEYEDSSKAQGERIGKAVSCFREKD